MYGTVYLVGLMTAATLTPPQDAATATKQTVAAENHHAATDCVTTPGAWLPGTLEMKTPAGAPDPQARPENGTPATDCTVA